MVVRFGCSGWGLWILCRVLRAEVEGEVVMIRRSEVVVEVEEEQDVVGLSRGLDDGHRHRLQFRPGLERLEEIVEVAQTSMKLAERIVLEHMLVLLPSGGP
jgi:hypothetical protein